MAPGAERIQTIKADFLDASLYEEEPNGRLAPISQGAVLAGLSRAFDLAEGRRPGHAQRVAYIGLALARELRLRNPRVEDVFFACFLHDAGMAVARVGAGVWDPRPGEQGDHATVMTAHTHAGARLARKLGLSETVARAIAGHHNLASDERPCSSAVAERAATVGRIVATADRVESLLDGEASPLWLRRTARTRLRELTGTEIDEGMAATLTQIMERDSFWLGLYDNDLGADLMALECGGDVEDAALLDLLGVISDLVDERACRPQGRGRRVAELARSLAERMAIPEGRLRLVEVAALLQDIGTLGVPARYLSKPDILTVDEMAAVQMHPTFARDIVSEIPGLGAAAWWIGCHHERIDGKGYPGMLEGDDVPLEAQIIGMAEAYEALRSERPYRAAMSRTDALSVIAGMSGTRFVPELMPPLEEATLECVAALA